MHRAHMVLDMTHVFQHSIGERRLEPSENLDRRRILLRRRSVQNASTPRIDGLAISDDLLTRHDRSLTFYKLTPGLVVKGGWNESLTGPANEHVESADAVIGVLPDRDRLVRQIPGVVRAFVNSALQHVEGPLEVGDDDFLHGTSGGSAIYGAVPGCLIPGFVYDQ